MDKLEKRQNDRVLLSLPIQYKVFQLQNLEKDVQDETLGLNASIADVSLGGLQMVSSGPLEPGQVLEMEMTLPGKGRVRSVAKIVWSRPEGKGEERGYRSGIHFIPVYEGDLEKLTEYLKEGY